MMNKVNKNIMVFGKNGQVGTEIHNLVLTNENNSDFSDALQFTFLERNDVDLSTIYELEVYLDKQDVCAIINAAAYTAVDKAEEEGDLATLVNTKAPEVMAIFAQNNEIPFIHISTDYVFDGTKDGIYVESDSVSPINMYGKSKAEGEVAILKANSEAIILRTSWVYAEKGNNFLHTMLRLGQEKDTLSIVSDQIGAPTNAKDIAKTILDILSIIQLEDYTPLENNVFHMTAQGETSWYGFAEYIFEQAKLLGIKTPDKIFPILTSDYKTLAQRPLNSRLDCSKLQDNFGIKLPQWQHSVRVCLHSILDDKKQIKKVNVL